MKKTIGIWLDHESAYLVHPEQDQAAEKIESGLGDQHAKAGVANSHESDGQKRELLAFYHKIAEAMGPVDQVLVLGPGTVKNEFSAYLTTHDKLKHVDLTTQAAQHMSEAQLNATVATHFGHAAKRHMPEVPGQPL